MDKRKDLVELIEQERKQLDLAVEAGLQSEEVFAQSKKMDELIDEYYKTEQN